MSRWRASEVSASDEEKPAERDTVSGVWVLSLAYL